MFLGWINFKLCDVRFCVRVWITIFSIIMMSSNDVSSLCPFVAQVFVQEKPLLVNRQSSSAFSYVLWTSAIHSARTIFSNLINNLPGGSPRNEN